MPNDSTHDDMMDGDMMGGMMDGGMMDGGMMGGGMAGWMFLWALVGLALLALAVVSILWLIRKPGSGTSSGWQRESADDVLRRRYASGEIDDDEFHRRMSALSTRQ